MEKYFSFALRAIQLCQHLSEKEKEFVLSRQILRSGTSIGANLEENRGVRSSSDFHAMISNVYKEARETSCRLDLLHASKHLTERQLDNLHTGHEELIRISSAAQLTMKTKIQKGK